MRKSKLFNNSLVFLLIICMSLVLFVGCQSKSIKNGNSQSNNGRPNTEQRKEQIQEDIKSLVTDGTINQSQADKIVEALTSNTQRGNGGPQNNGQGAAQGSGRNNNGQGSTQGSGQNNNGQDKSQGNRQFNNPLSKLVSDGVITQAQADAVMQKVRGNFQRPQGEQTSKQ